MSGGFVAGFLRGAVLSVVVVSAVSLVAPLPPRDPGKSSQVDLSTPDGSGFNAERKDSNPVLPNTDSQVSKDATTQPELEATDADKPITGTETAAQPETESTMEMPAVTADTGDDTIALSVPEAEQETTSITPPALGLAMPAIDNPVTDIPVNRLPIINAPDVEIDDRPAVDSNGNQQSSEAPGAEDGTVVSPRVEPSGDGALMKNRMPYQNPNDKPLMSVILLDAGDDGLGQDVLMTFSFPVTFALDAAKEGVTADAKILHQAGFEVMTLAPEGLSGDPALGPVFATMPESIGLVSRSATGLQADQDLAEKLIAGLAASGHGLVTYDAGFNTTDKKAAKAGVPSGVVFRVLDGDRESAAVIKRYLDRAVLEAEQVGHVIVLGRTYPETVTSLFSWAVSAKSASVALVPVSAAMLSR